MMVIRKLYWLLERLGSMEAKRLSQFSSWELKHTYSGEWVVIGNVYGDDRFEDGTPVITSKVLKIDFECGTIETMNTIYSFI